MKTWPAVCLLTAVFTATALAEAGAMVVPTLTGPTTLSARYAATRAARRDLSGVVRREPRTTASVTAPAPDPVPQTPTPEAPSPTAGLSGGTATLEYRGWTTLITFSVKYWNADNVPPDHVWLAIGHHGWFGDLQPMSPVDRSDADYTDGAWYTCSLRGYSDHVPAFRFSGKVGDLYLEWDGAAPPEVDAPTPPEVDAPTPPGVHDPTPPDVDDATTPDPGLPVRTGDVGVQSEAGLSASLMTSRYAATRSRRPSSLPIRRGTPRTTAPPTETPAPDPEPVSQAPSGGAALSDGTVTLQYWGWTTLFTFSVKYWNAGNVPPDHVWLAIGHHRWFGDLRPMSPVDASDTDYTDGAWYSCTTRGYSDYVPAFRFVAKVGDLYLEWDSEAPPDVDDPTPPDVDDPTPPDVDDPTPPDVDDPTPPDVDDPAPPDVDDPTTPDVDDPTTPDPDVDDPTTPDPGLAVRTGDVSVQSETGPSPSLVTSADKTEVQHGEYATFAVTVALPSTVGEAARDVIVAYRPDDMFAAADGEAPRVLRSRAALTWNGGSVQSQVVQVRVRGRTETIFPAGNVFIVECGDVSPGESVTCTFRCLTK